MNRRPLTVAVALALVALSGAAQEFSDPHSLSRPDEVAVTHLDLDLTVDFAAKTLAGTASLTVERRAPGAEQLWLDTNGLDIVAVRLDGAPEPVAHRLSTEIPLLGRALSVPLGPETRVVHVDYRTRPDAAALQWLDPAQTAGGRHPFLFTQSQPILARTWVPCQDSPGARATYRATIRTSPELVAVMSATNPRQKRPDGVYRFEMKQPIPSYLLALAVGDLEFRELGRRSGVYAEPSVVEPAAWELADTEAMITAAERLYGPYRWGRYDLLILPPSFPYGGMENPRLTFATPTILAGDKSLVALVAHELAHSWSGNLVTNATWNDFWLNEGFTSYIENRIMEAVYGADYAAMLQLLSRREIEKAVAEEGSGARSTWLYGDLGGRDPEGYVAEIVYDKGALLLHTLEDAVGRQTWDRFLRQYFDEHAFRTMTSRGFVDSVSANLLDERPEAAGRVDVTGWVYGPGIPPNAHAAVSPAFDQVDREVNRFLTGTPAADLATAGWVTQQWQRFLERLGSGLPLASMADLDATFGFTRSGNSEVLAAWLGHAIAAQYEPADPALERFLTTVGRRKFLKPLYEELAKTPAGLARGKALYAKARPGYHAVSRVAVDEILGWKE
ncbi:MAG TPA: M1 family metallopeptidase [Thermoanaerobaculia bacterium]|jgi:aminopeptidase N